MGVAAAFTACGWPGTVDVEMMKGQLELQPESVEPAHNIRFRVSSVAGVEDWLEMRASNAEDPRILQTEARVFSRYLVGRNPPDELIDRYEKANGILFAEPCDRRDAALIGFVGRHPWSVSFLDAASGLLRPSGLLRGKILTMGAILETSPEFADDFLPREEHPAAFVFHLLILGVVAVACVVLGSLLYGVAIRSRP
jgi:hypothetical protein